MEKSNDASPLPFEILDQPSRPRWAEGSSKVTAAPNYGQPWTAEDMRYVIRHPEASFEEVARELKRSPGGVNRMRVLAREVAGLQKDSGDKSNTERKQLMRQVLTEEGLLGRSAAELKDLLPRGHGSRSDKTGVALNRDRRMVKQLLKEIMAEKG